MPRVATRREIEARLSCKGYSADQIKALFLAFDLLRDNQRAIDPAIADRLESTQAPANLRKGADHVE